MIEGDACRAFRKISRTPFSDSPTHLERSSGPLIEMKLRLALVRDRLGEQGLSRPRRPEEEDPLRGLGLELGEDRRVFERPLDRFLEFLLHVVETADILPGDIRDLDEDLAHGARFDVPACLVEVVAG